MSTAGTEEKDVSQGLEVKSYQFDSEASGVEESLELTPQELRRLKRIVDWRILPYISLLYLLSTFTDIVRANRLVSYFGWIYRLGFLDRVNLTLIFGKFDLL